MDPEVIIWLIVSVIGLVAVPFVAARRSKEWSYYRTLPTVDRSLLLRSRVSRALILSVGILMASGVAFVSILVPPSEDRRTWSVIMLVMVNICMVGTLWSDEYWARRIDHQKER